MRYAKRTDDNHRAVIDELREALPEATVHDLSGTGKGTPDCAVGWRGMTFLYEIKDGDKPPSARSLTPAQKEFHGKWQGHAAVVTSAATLIADMLRRAADGRGIKG